MLIEELLPVVAMLFVDQNESGWSEIENNRLAIPELFRRYSLAPALNIGPGNVLHDGCSLAMYSGYPRKKNPLIAC
jgi:hypothetical protein